MADSKLEIILSAKDQTKGAFGAVESSLSGLGKATSAAGSALGTIAKVTTVAAVAVGGALVTGLGGAVKSAMSFESAMSKVGAASQASSSEMKGLHDLALSLGSDLQLAGVDATDAALAMEELAKGGVSVSDQMGGATKGALLLFSAGADSVAQATDVAVKSMNIFGLSGGDVAHVADLMAAGAGKSATSVGQLGAAFNQSAAVAKNAGLSIEELTGTLSFLAQRGMEGSDAGTSLKTALLALQAPTDVAQNLMEDLGINVRDANGEMLPMAQIADVLKDKLSGLSAAQRDAALKTIFGNDAIRVGIALYEGGGDAITEWTKKVDDAGYAAKIGGQRNDNLASSFEQLKANLQTSAIIIGEKFLPVLRKATDAASDLATKFLQSKDVQDALQRLADEGGKALDRLIAKVKDPVFQAQMKDWAKAAVDTAKALADLAGTVKDTLGPPLQAAVGWFNDLDAAGKKNVVTFGLLTVAAVKLAGPIATLAGSLGTLAKVAATAATSTTALAIGMGLLVAAAATGAWAGIIALMVKYRDATGETVKMQGEFTRAMDATAFAQEHGATALNDHVAGFARYLDMSNTQIKTQDDLVAAWNRYLNVVSLGGNSTAGLTLAIAQSGAAATTAGASLTGYNTQISQAEIATRALASGAPLLASGLNAAANAAGGLAVPVQASALAIADLNSYGTVAQQTMNGFANNVAVATLALQAVEGRTQAAATAMAIAEIDTGEFGTTIGLLRSKILELTTSYNTSGQAVNQFSGENQRLGGFLSVLQAEWDKTDAAVKASGKTTDEQKATYERLAPAIQYLNGVMGENSKGVLDNVLKMVGLEGQLKNTGVSYETAGKAAGATFSNAMKTVAVETGAAKSALATAEGAAKAFGGSATTAAGGANTQATAMRGAAEAAAFAQGRIAGLATTIAMLPKSFTITAHVDISAATANIQTLSNMIPRSPAKEGPFRKLPDWMALYDQLRPAGDWAIATLGGTTKAMAGALKGAVDDAAKTAAEIASAVAKAVTDVLGASTALAQFDSAKNSPTGAQLGWFGHLTSSLIATMGAAAANFKEEALKHTSDFADTVGKVGSSVKNAVEGLAAIGTAKWAEVSPTGSALGWFTHLMTSLVQNFVQAAKGFDEDGLKAASGLADTAGKIGGSISATLGGLAALASADWAKSSPSGSAMAWFSALVAQLVQAFATAAAQFETEVLASANRLAETATKVAGVIGPALAGFKELATIVAPSQTSIDQLVAGIAYLVKRFGEMAATMAAEGVKAMGDFADATNKALSAAKTGTDLFKSFDKLVIPSAKAIDDLANGIRYIVGKFRDMATMLTGEGLAAMSAFATTAGQVLGAAKTGTDLFASMEKLAVPSAAAIDYLLGSMGYVITQTQAIANGIGTEGLAAAQKFATGSLNVFTTIKTALEQFAKLEAFKDIPTDILRDLFKALEGAVDFSGQMVGRADEILQNSIEFLDKMANAALNFARGEALGGSGAPLTAPAGVGGGSGGGERGPAGDVYNLNLSGNIYGMADFQDAVVGSLEDAARRGRT